MILDGHVFYSESQIIAALSQKPHEHTSSVSHLPGQPPAPKVTGSDPELCAACLCPLASAHVGVGVDRSGRRTCPHYFHYACLKRVRPRCCPQCRVPFVRCVVLPSIVEDSAAWGLVARSGDGALSRLEVLSALKAMLPLPTDEVDAMITRSWADWTKGENALPFSMLDELAAALT